ncbi:hypothetical protein C1H46_008006 [Malus baccata]|uniref:DUF1731 domain-containing protein n=1 Tax=Malus baccata TaxID=106549 RepID=A0A540N5Q3_MALBA|nr:hypothetical protein C1H46_008006 [Malus baccata]
MEVCGATALSWTHTVSTSLHVSLPLSKRGTRGLCVWCASDQPQKVVLGKSVDCINNWSYGFYREKIGAKAACSRNSYHMCIVSLANCSFDPICNADNHSVHVLTRSRSKAELIFPVKDFPGIMIAEEPQWKDSIQGSTGVVNLGGLPISTRWSPEIKKEIKTSRIRVTSKVIDLINNLPDAVRPTVLVSATAVGYYGTSETQIFDEQSPSGNDYLAEVCREWEGTALKVNKDVRLALIRIGVVLGKDGGALAKMIPLFMVFAGGPLGSGKQWFSWIHLDDIVNLIYEALSNPSYKGVINGTAPNPVRFAEMCEHLGNVLGRPSWLPVPDFALKAVLGEGASVVVDGQRVLPVRAEELGFSFKYSYVRDALRSIISQKAA